METNLIAVPPYTCPHIKKVNKPIMYSSCLQCNQRTERLKTPIYTKVGKYPIYQDQQSQPTQEWCVEQGLYWDATQISSPRVYPERRGPFLSKKYLHKGWHTMVQTLVTKCVAPDSEALERHYFRLRQGPVKGRGIPWWRSRWCWLKTTTQHNWCPWRLKNMYQLKQTKL